MLPHRSRRFSIKIVIDVLASILMAAAAVVIIWRGSAGGTTTRPERLSGLAVENVQAAGLATNVTGLPRHGDAAARVVMIEFSDFECPFCGKFARETFDEIDRSFIKTGKIQYAFRHFPLEKIHKAAMPAAHAAECAGAQGQFWPMHKRLFAARGRFGEGFWSREAGALKLDVGTFDACLARAEQTRVRADIEEARRLGVESTPTFLIGRAAADGTVQLATRIRGAQSYDAFKDALAPLLDTGTK